jgi:hypothetical protein
LIILKRCYNEKVLLIILAVTVTVNLYGDAAGKKISSVIRDLDLKARNISDVVRLTEETVPSIVSINRENFKAEILVSNKIGDTSIYKVGWKYKGIPVEGRYTVLKAKNDSVFKIHNNIEQFEIETVPTVDKLTAARNIFTIKYPVNTSMPDFISDLVILNRGGGYRLAWKIRFRPESPVDGRFFYVDAHTGKSLGGGNFVMSLSENTAKVFETNPVRDKEAITVELPWIADDLDGKLTAALDEKGVRKVVATNCLDLGDKMDYYGQQYPICTPTQVADKYENGNFIYEDWANGVAFKQDAEDVYSEVSVYYHLSKVYKYLLELGISEFSHLSNHRVGTENNPIIGVSNFQMPQRHNHSCPDGQRFLQPSRSLF